MTTQNTPPRPGFDIRSDELISYTAHVLNWATLARVLNQINPNQFKNEIERAIFETWKHGIQAAVHASLNTAWLDEHSLNNAKMDVQEYMEVFDDREI